MKLPKEELSKLSPEAALLTYVVAGTWGSSSSIDPLEFRAYDDDTFTFTINVFPRSEGSKPSMVNIHKTATTWKINLGLIEDEGIGVDWPPTGSRIIEAVEQL